MQHGIDHDGFGAVVRAAKASDRNDAVARAGENADKCGESAATPVRRSIAGECAVANREPETQTHETKKENNAKVT